MGKCILTGVEITESANNDSEAHIIPSALGGRLKPKGILSDDGNNILWRKVDNQLIQALQPYMTLLDGSRDRGGSPALVPAKGKDGKRYMMGANEIRTLDFEYNVKEVDGKPVGNIKAPSMKHAKELIGKTKKKFNLSSAEVDEKLDNAQRIAEDPGILETRIVAGPAVEFPAAFTMSALFCAYHGQPVRPDFVSYLGSFDETPTPRPLPKDTFYFIHKDNWFTLDAEMGHCLILYCDPTRNQAIFFSQLFKLLGIAVLIPYDGNDIICCTYGVDILEGKEVSVQVDKETLAGLDWKATHILGEDELFAINQERGTALMKLAGDRQFKRAQEAIVAKHTSGRDSTIPMTRQERTAYYRDLKDLLKKTFSPDSVDLANDNLKRQFEKLGDVDD
jgi:hypothetical protein